jgi:hypothetical protein
VARGATASLNFHFERYQAAGAQCGAGRGRALGFHQAFLDAAGPVGGLEAERGHA